MSPRLLALAFAAALAPPAAAQLATSPAYRLDDFAFAGGGGGSSSSTFWTFDAAQPLSGDEAASDGFRAVLGFLGAWDPQPPPSPIVFGASPDCGPSVGGAIVSIGGVNFDLFGSGPTVGAQIGGNAVFPLVVLSSTRLVGVTPPGAPGDVPLAVSSSLGSDTLENGFHVTAGLQPFGTGTPGCLGPHLVGANSCPTVGNAGFRITCELAPPSSLGLGLVGAAADVPGSDPFAFGVLFHVDLVLSGASLLALDFFSDSTGHGEAVAPIPASPALAGATLYAQALWAWASCALPPLQLSATPGLRITIDP